MTDMEVSMDRTMAEDEHISTTEQRMLDVLNEAGPFTLDTLSTRFDMSWAQIFLAVDRLSRSRHVALHRTQSREYVVSTRGVA
jgi:hypothetical protein